MIPYLGSGYFPTLYNRNNSTMEEDSKSVSIKMEDDNNNNNESDDDGDDQLGQEYEPELPQPQKHYFQQNLHSGMDDRNHHQTGLDQLPPKQRVSYQNL
jgi:hypothetical protein